MALAVVGPLPWYVVAMFLCGLTTGMGYSLGQVAVQNVVPERRSGEASSVLLTSLIAIGGVGVVVAATAIESGGAGPSHASIARVLVTVAGLLLVTGCLTLVVGRRLRA